MNEIEKARSFEDWLYKPSFEESVCTNPFRDTVLRVFDDAPKDHLSPDGELDLEHPYVKLGQLLKKNLIMLEGDVIYVREKNNVHPLNESIPLLAYYMHTDTREAAKAAAVLESNFMGYFPISSGKVWRNGISLLYPDGSKTLVNLSTLQVVDEMPGFPEFGQHRVDITKTDVIAEYFWIMNQAIGEPFFFEKTLMYPFNQTIREKSPAITGDGGNGKGIFMLMVKRLYGQKAYCDSPQPTFKGHDAAVISYNFIGKKVVTFNDVGDPSPAFLEWLKRMITGNLEVKTPSGAWMSVPCSTNFMLETNYRPQILDINAHKRRYILREFLDLKFQLKDHMSSEHLDIVGERGTLTAGDVAHYIATIGPMVKNWTEFGEGVEQFPTALHVSDELRAGGYQEEIKL